MRDAGAGNDGRHMTKFNPYDDIDPVETNEWLESIDSVLTYHGPERAHFLLNRMIDFARRSGAYLPYSPNTAYVNTIAPGRQPEYPGDRALERSLRPRDAGVKRVREEAEEACIGVELHPRRCASKRHEWELLAGVEHAEQADRSQQEPSAPEGGRPQRGANE